MAAASSSGFRQDMPPRGGYPAINYIRAIPKQRFSGWTVIMIGLTMMVGGFAVITKCNRDKRKDAKERLRGRLHLISLLQAEEDRRVLRMLKAADDEEALIMKDVPGWEVGKSVYNTSKWIPPHPAQLKDIDGGGLSSEKLEHYDM